MSSPPSPPSSSPNPSGAAQAPAGASEKKGRKGAKKAALKEKKAKTSSRAPSASFFKKTVQFFVALFTNDVGPDENIPDEKDALRRHERLVTMIWWQGVAIIVLTSLLILSAPFLRPYYKYYTLSPNNQRTALVPLDKPNMTDRALLSWATTSITEILTIGFGDFDRKILAQRRRFTEAGWESFMKAMVAEKLRHEFKSRQLVLTTVPSDSPVIIARGIDVQGDGEYEWIVEMPIIMTYVTNNNVQRQSRAIIRLAITRVSDPDSIRGVAIKTWKVGN